MKIKTDLKIRQNGNQQKTREGRRGKRFLQN